MLGICSAIIAAEYQRAIEAEIRRQHEAYIAERERLPIYEGDTNIPQVKRRKGGEE